MFKLIHFTCSSSLLSINALAVVFAATIFITPPFSFKIIRKCRTFSYIVPSMIRRPTRFFAITLECSDNLSFSWYSFFRLLALLSPNSRLEKDLLNFFTAVIGPWMVVYFPITYLSLSLNLQFLRFLLLFWMVVVTAVWSNIPGPDSSCVGNWSSL